MNLLFSSAASCLPNVPLDVFSHSNFQTSTSAGRQEEEQQQQQQPHQERKNGKRKTKYYQTWYSQHTRTRTPAARHVLAQRTWPSSKEGRRMHVNYGQNIRTLRKNSVLHPCWF
ncbi:uncharacterized protein LOC120454187 [Drosophila santomea]|uniref:uncharacterized protein LOC120454187 n=1 Tax=Drosophila santomea TaxID=129105 RepID=UPI0019533C2D|nr:uncharacterized protein LOC120454187 [Drosophila santomea]